MTDDHAARELPGITVVIAPRGAGKSHLLWRSVIEARAREENAIWIDAGASHDAPALAPAELIVVDRVNPRDASHLALMQTVLTAFRGGSVCRVMIATRSAELLNHHLHPWLHDYTTVTAGGLALDPGRVAAMAERLGTSITEKQSALIADESDGWAWAASIGVAATRTRPRATDDDLRRSMRQRVRDAVAHQLTRQQRLVFTATTIIDHSTLSAAGVSDANTWLADAEADGWLTRDAADTPYRVPAALTRALRSGPDEFPGTLATLRVRLVRSRLAEGSYAKAVDIALASDDADLIADVAHHVARAGRVSDVYRIADALKGRDLRWFGQHTDLLGAAALMGRGRGRRYSDWQQAAREVLKRGPTSEARAPADELYSLAIRIVAHRAVGDLAASTECANRASALWNRVRTRVPAAAAAAALALNSAAVTFTVNNEYVRALNAVSEAIACARTIGDPALEYINVSTQVAIHAVHGDIAAAHAALLTAPELDERERPPITLGHIGVAILAAERRDLAHTDAEAMLLIQQDTEFWWLAHYSDAAVSAADGPSRASDVYEQAIRDGVRRGFVVNAPDFHGLRLGELQILAGQLGRARTTLSRLDPDLPHARLLTSVIELATGDWRTARSLARISPADSTPRMTATRGLVLAAASAVQGHAVLASEFLESTLARMMQWQLSSPLRFLTQPSREHLRAAAERLDAQHRAFLAEQLAIHDALSPSQTAHAALSARESEIIALLGTGARGTDIAASLGISRNTVKTLTRRLYQKLGVASRSEAIDAALETGLLDADRL